MCVCVCVTEFIPFYSLILMKDDADTIKGTSLTEFNRQYSNMNTYIHTSSARIIGLPIIDGNINEGKFWPAYPTCGH